MNSRRVIKLSGVQGSGKTALVRTIAMARGLQFGEHGVLFYEPGKSHARRWFHTVVVDGYDLDALDLNNVKARLDPKHGLVIWVTNEDIL